MNSVDAFLCVACGAALGLTRLERRPDPDAPVAVGIITASLAVGIVARAMRNEGWVSTQTIYYLNPVMDALIGAWAVQHYRAKPREWLQFLKMSSYAAIGISVAYGAAVKTPDTRYLYAVALNALLIAGLCAIGARGARDGLSALARYGRRALATPTGAAG